MNVATRGEIIPRPTRLCRRSGGRPSKHPCGTAECLFWVRQRLEILRFQPLCWSHFEGLGQRFGQRRSSTDLKNQPLVSRLGQFVPFYLSQIPLGVDHLDQYHQPGVRQVPQPAAHIRKELRE